ncbi:MAG: phosphatase PAP2 family protein [Elusimicrobia bacterium]|nr:phosphatase PAP2 family protein [Elusimicrobiota bacterium]
MKTSRRSGIVALSFLLAAAGLVPSAAQAGPSADELLSLASLSGAELSLPQAPSPAAAADAPGVFDTPTDRVYYVSPWQVDMSGFQPPPAEGSAEDRRDLAEVLRWQAERTEAQCAVAADQAQATYESFFGEISPFGPSTPAEVGKILQKIKLDTSSVVFLQKRKYARPRPFLRDPAIRPCLKKESGYAYPSGHSTAARVFGLLLSDLVPSESAEFMSYADQAALNRVIAGVHHPSDIEAGKKLGDAVYAALRRSPSFKKDMAVLRKNLRP